MIVCFLFYNLITYNSILLPGNGYPFDLNREVAGHLKQLVDNKHDPLVEVRNMFVFVPK